MKKSKISIRQITIAGMMAALSIILSMVAARTDVFRFTIEGFPLMVAGFLFGPVTGVLSGLVAGFISQAVSPYGLGPTTPIWMLSPIVWGLVGGLFSKYFKKYGISIYDLLVATIITSLSVTVINTLSLVLDSVYYGATFLQAITATLVRVPFRILTALILAVVYTLILYEVLPRLSKVTATYNAVGELKRNNFVDSLKHGTLYRVILAIVLFALAVVIYILAAYYL